MTNSIEAVNARSQTLAVLAAGGDLDAVHQALALAVRGKRDAQPYLEELLSLVIDSYRLTGASLERPIELDGLADRYLPEYDYRGKVDHRNLRYALTYPALRAGGLDVDVWNDIIYWRTELWPYALHAVVAYLRIAAERTGTTIDDLARRLQQQS